jgi:misacylated tRNA(Ala) deacylase
MTRELFREDSYLKTCSADITAITDAGIQTDQSIFYPLGGGQLGDTGWLVTPDGSRLDISNTQKDRDTGMQYHNIDAPHSLAVGDSITLELDWPRRYRLMRFHSALHMLCSLIDAPVTSGSIQVDRARLDFDLQNPIDKEPITQALNELVQRNVAMTTRWITDAELAAQPELVRTMSVQPPRNAQGTIRLVEFEGVDLQPCGGTHVASTAEIGAVRIQKTEKKGKQNRRIIVVLDE